MKKIIVTIFIVALSLQALYSADKKNLIFYCGITMVKPMTKIAKVIEDKYNCNITISQGGSQDLLDSLKLAKKGDLYLPGSDSYINRNMELGIFKRQVHIGNNKAALFVQKGNPKNIKSLEDIIKPEINSVICDSEAGSIGRMSKKILYKYGGEDFFYNVFDRAIAIGTDSRDLNKYIKQKIADVTINWKSTAYFKENVDFIDVVDIDENYAKPKKLVLTLLSFSQNKEIANAFIDYASSKEGKEIMSSYGF